MCELQATVASKTSLEQKFSSTSFTIKLRISKNYDTATVL